MPEKLPINIGDTVKFKKGKIGNYLVINCSDEKCSLQRKAKSKILKNSNPIIKNVLKSDLYNITGSILYLKEYYQRNKEKSHKTTTERRKKNKEIYNKQISEYRRKRKAEDPDFFNKIANEQRQKERPGKWRVLLKINS